MTKLRPIAALLSAVAVAFTPAVAMACPVCLSGEDANRSAYLFGFVLLTTLPLAGLGALFLYLRRRARELDAADDEARAVTPAPIPSERALPL